MKGENICDVLHRTLIMMYFCEEVCANLLGELSEYDEYFMSIRANSLKFDKADESSLGHVYILLYAR